MMNSYENNERSPFGYSAEQTSTPMGDMGTNNLSGVAKIKVVGVGGAGNNAVDRLIESGLQSAEYIVINTDNQALARSRATKRIQIGVQLTKGLGAGANPEVGKAAAEENKEAIQEALKNTDLLFITAGMGGGTGTGAAPVIARIAKEMKILTVAVVTLPFGFEAKRRMDNALVGVEELKKNVDSMITIPNDKIRQVVPKNTSFADALKVADDVLRQGIRGIAELIVKPSLINLDFADVKATLKGRGLAHMGIGVAKGEKRIFDAVRCAVCSPLLNTTIEGANSVILNVIGGKDLSLDEVTTAADLVKGVIDYSANVIFGACIDEAMSDEVEVVIIATGFGGNQNGFSRDAQNATLRQATVLAQKIDNAYNRREGGMMQNGYMQQQPMYADPYVPQQPNVYNPQSSYAATQAQANEYMSNVQPIQPIPNGYAQPNGYPQQPNTFFEPNDPIPDARQEETPDRKHRPKFVDFFMKKNSDDK